MKFFNRIKLAAAYFVKQPAVWGRPVEVGIEITNRCNLACIMCPRQKLIREKPRPIGDMDQALFEKIIKEITPFAEIVYLHGLGEALLHPGLFKMIAYAKKKGVKVGLSTNATLMDRKKADQLIKSGLDYIIFAIDGASEKTYRKIRRGGNFQTVSGNIHYFLEQKKRSSAPVFTVVQMIAMSQNQSERDEFIKTWTAAGADVVRVKPVIDFLQHKKPGKKILKQNCFYPYRMINIYFDGTVVPCCQDNFAGYPLGNFQTMSLPEIFNSQAAQKLRSSLAAEKRKGIGICRGCTQPQPSLLGIIGSSLFDNLTVKKILPLVERLPFIRDKMISYD